MDLEINVLTGFEHLTRGLITEHKNILIHYISDPRKGKNKFDMDNILALFEEYQVSSHYIIARSGKVYQMVHPDKKAWHAGKSEFNGVTGLNRNSIGIELAGDDFEEFTLEQYDSLIKLCSGLCKRYKIPTLNIKGHQIVSDSKVRSDPKPDPGRFFDWIGFGYGLISYMTTNEDIMEEHF